ncbi:MAG: 50S ribosomal protein L5 [Holosporaceae bacterium]|jgi:large subunit ribosomal protein L5|nr:50S ribosomal protein L5 [Holosporaceae bacterium]
MTRLKDYYFSTIVPALKKDLELANDLQVPRLQKIVLNMGVGEGIADSKHVKQAVEELTSIAGQRAVVTIARKSVAGFKLRQGQKIGAMVTLRGERMYEFLDRLINIALPRVRDFRGLSRRSFDGRGNYSFGIKEQIVFTEVSVSNVDNIRGLDVAVVTTASDNAQAEALLGAFNFPFMV